MIENSPTEGVPGSNQQQIKDKISGPEVSTISLISSAYAQEEKKSLSCTTGVLSSNATLVSKKYVSSCKPHYSGFLGFGSFFNNSIVYCESQYTIPKDERVKLLQSWETGLRVIDIAK